MSPEETGDHLRVSWNNKIHMGTKRARWKSSISGRLVSWPQIKKVSVFKCCLLLFYATMNHFLIELWHAMESKFNMMTGDNQLSGWTKKKLQSTSQSQTYTKKSHGHCLVVCCPSDPLQLSESQQWNHYIWEVSSVNQWNAPKTAMPAASIIQQKGANSSLWQYLTAQRYFGSWANWATKFCLICHIHLTSRQPTTTSSSILSTFFKGKTLPQPAGGRKCFPRVHRSPEYRSLCYRNK